MPHTAELLHPALQQDITDHLKARQLKQQISYDKDAKDLNQLGNCDKVRVRKRNSWQRGEIIKVLDIPRSYRVQVEGGYTVERNRKHITTDSKTTLLCFERRDSKSSEPEGIGKEPFNVEEQFNPKSMANRRDSEESPFDFTGFSRLNDGLIEQYNEDPTIRTRSGRAVARLSYLKSFVY
ncbi:hypothetical protein PR048_011186 [Dryococelus australis]|uniref:Uncharacterized protein n=1 Tax=Dryococelus australis TaxID=614101 RepID=A0ABQ9HL25_9NEOP|nr:hypothetical protein PR048_011186 [Dryococelus australis]